MFIKVQALLFTVFGSCGPKNCIFDFKSNVLDFLVASAQASSRKISIFFFYLSFIVLDKNVPLSFTIKIYMRHYLIKTLCSLIQ